MIPRRLLLSGLMACGIGAALPVRAADRPNSMPNELRAALERDPTAPVLDNPQGDITLSMFFDYNCPHCRRMVGPIQALIASDPRLRVIYHEWPVFGAGSDFAARASLPRWKPADTGNATQA